MNSTQSDRFWIIFDVCLRPEYYQDVHNLLALPRGAIIRYEYRRKYLTPDSIKAVENGELPKANILLFYGQQIGYKKGNAAPNVFEQDKMLWIPTRFGEMVATTQSGDTYFFDFKVLGYPLIDNSLIETTIKPLVAKNEVPLEKFICVSNDLKTFNELRKGDDESNWQNVVNVLASDQTQFRGDSFWRIKGPYFDRRAVDVNYQEDKFFEGDQEILRGVTSYYEMLEENRYSLEVVSYTPTTSDDHSAGDIDIPRKLEIKQAEKGPIAVLSNTSVDLRQYTGRTIEMRPQRSEDIDDKIGFLNFNTISEGSNYPTGPNISLKFLVNKKLSNIIRTIIFGVISVVLLAVGVVVVKDNVVWGIVLLVLGALSTILTFLYYNGTIKFKA